MNLDSRLKLADIVRAGCEKHGQRGYARKLGVSQATVAGWLESRSVPSTDNLRLIADEAGYSLEELLEFLDGMPSPKSEVSMSEQILKLMRSVSKDELAKVLESGIRLLVTSR